MLKWFPSCYFKPKLNSYKFASLLSAWILFLSFCNIVSLTSCGLLRLKNCFFALRYSWIIPSKILKAYVLFILASHSELLLFVCSGDNEISPGLKTKN